MDGQHEKNDIEKSDSKKHRKDKHKKDKCKKEKCKKSDSHEHKESRGHKGEKGSRGHKGEKGSRGHKGEKGSRGHKGEKGSRGKNDQKKCIDFQCEKGIIGLYHSFQVDYFPFIAYGYENNDLLPDCPTELFQSKKNGLGIAKVECHEINHNTYIQFDFQSLRDCSVKKVKLNVGSNKGYYIYGSDCLGEFGKHLFTSYHKKCSIPYQKYKYISITSKHHVSVYSLSIKRSYSNACLRFFNGH